jgi:hypothetical protein
MRTRAAAWSLCLWCLACGAPAAPASAPEPTAEPPPGAEATPASDTADPTTTKADPAASAPASDADLNAILQLVVDDPELDTHLHLGQAGRFPLQIAGERLPRELKLVKGNEPVKLVDSPKSKKDPVLVFTEIEVQGDKATVRYRYDVEGIRATVTLARGGHGWELKNSRLVEH